MIQKNEEIHAKKKTIAINSTNVVVAVVVVLPTLPRVENNYNNYTKKCNLCVFDHFCHFRLSALPLFLFLPNTIIVSVTIAFSPNPRHSPFLHVQFVLHNSFFCSVHNENNKRNIKSVSSFIGNWLLQRHAKGRKKFNTMDGSRRCGENYSFTNRFGIITTTTTTKNRY